MTEREMYLGAIKVLRKGGWCKGASEDDTGRHCMVGAIYAMSRGLAWPRACALLDVVGREPMAAADFNDYHCKSVDDAIGALQIAADLAA